MIKTIALVLLAFGFGYSQGVQKLSQLTQISKREWIDLNKISFIRLPVFLEPISGCPECQLRWGGDLVVDGVLVAYTEESDLIVKQLVGK